MRVKTEEPRMRLTTDPCETWVHGGGIFHRDLPIFVPHGEDALETSNWTELGHVRWGRSEVLVDLRVHPLVSFREAELGKQSVHHRYKS